MSMVDSIQKMILEKFNDGNAHLFKEYQDMAVRKGIISEDNTTAVNNAIQKMKSINSLANVGKGRYIVKIETAKTNAELDVNPELDVNAEFKKLINRIQKISEMNVFNSTNEELANAKKDFELYKKNIKIINKIIDR